MFSLWVSLIDRIFWIWETKHNIIAIIVCSLSPLSPNFSFFIIIIIIIVLLLCLPNLLTGICRYILWPLQELGVICNALLHWSIEYEYHCHRYDRHNFHLQHCAWKKTGNIYNFAFRLEKSCIFGVQMDRYGRNCQNITSKTNQRWLLSLISLADPKKLWRAFDATVLP